ncbi:MAG TPA: hypothetical protein VMW47_00865 [Verrucomicrobiae bacterium]|nr:hypothetical protein [Verrucomicrobiae bacterium]
MTDRGGYRHAIWAAYGRAQRAMLALYVIGGAIALLVLRLR